jgi:hypothetical protein
VLRVEDSETAGSDWEEILRNERINRTSCYHKHMLLILTKKRRKDATTIFV